MTTFKRIALANRACGSARDCFRRQQVAVDPDPDLSLPVGDSTAGSVLYRGG